MVRNVRLPHAILLLGTFPPGWWITEMKGMPIIKKLFVSAVALAAGE